MITAVSNGQGLCERDIFIDNVSMGKTTSDYLTCVPHDWWWWWCKPTPPVELEAGAFCTTTLVWNEQGRWSLVKCYEVNQALTSTNGWYHRRYVLIICSLWLKPTGQKKQLISLVWQVMFEIEDKHI